MVDDVCAIQPPTFGVVWRLVLGIVMLRLSRRNRKYVNKKIRKYTGGVPEKLVLIKIRHGTRTEDYPRTTRGLPGV